MLIACVPYNCSASQLRDWKALAVAEPAVDGTHDSFAPQFVGRVWRGIIPVPALRSVALAGI